MQVDLMILNYNGASYVLETISSFLAAIKNSHYSCQLTVIDNVSTDQSVSLIQKHYPVVKLVRMKENKVLCAFNDAAQASSADIVFLLNNDLKTAPDAIDPMVDKFQRRDDLFMVAPKSFLMDQTYEGGLARPFFKYGIFGTTCKFNGYELLKEKSQPTFATGFGAFHRLKFLELGGFDNLYLPGRMEDVDLAFRAWKKGWRSEYEPRSIFYHIGAKSFHERFGERGTMELAYQNTFLFMWKNLRSLSCLLSHFFFLIPWMLWMLTKGRFEFITAFCKAVAKLPTTLKRRKLEKSIRYQYSDKEVLALFRHGN